MWDYLLLAAVLLVVILIVICSLTGCYPTSNFSTSLQRSQEILSPDLRNDVTTIVNDKAGNSNVTYYLLGGIGVVCFVTFTWRLIKHHLDIAKTSQATNQD
jgi:hypothetical protein